MILVSRFQEFLLAGVKSNQIYDFIKSNTRVKQRYHKTAN